MNADVMYRGVVYPWQCDHVGHMNIMWYVGKFDEANWNFLARIGLTPGYVRESGHVLAAVQQNISYRREMLAGDTVDITSQLLEIGQTSVRFRHEMRNAESADITATCEMIAVHMDRKRRKSSPWPSVVLELAQQRLSMNGQPTAPPLTPTAPREHL